MYSLLLFFILLATLADNWIWFGLALGLGLLTHNQMILYLPGLIVVFVLQHKRPGMLARYQLQLMSGRLLKSLLLAGLIYAPWASTAWRQLQAVSGQYWIAPATAGRVIDILAELIAGYNMPGPAMLVVAGLGLEVLLIGLGLAIWSRRYEPVILAMGPVAVGVALSVAVTPVLISRVLIGIVPFMLILIALGGYELYKVAGHWVTVAAIAATLTIGWSLAMPATVKIDYAEAYNALGVAAGEHCYHLTAGGAIMGDYYLPQCRHITWSDAPKKPNGLSDQTIEALGIERGQFSGQDWIFATWEPFTPQAEREHLASILAGRQATQFMIMPESEFVTDSAWRLDDD